MSKKTHQYQMAYSLCKSYLFCFAFFTLISSHAIAQDDYVITEPVEEDTPQVFPNPDYTNYSFSSSAFTLKKHNMQLLGTDILFAKFSYGFTDKTTLSANTSLFGTTIISIKQRFSFSEDLNFAISASAGNIFYLNEDSIIRFGGGQALFTLGDKQNNFTFGVGLYFGKSTFKFADDTDVLFLHNFFVATQRQIGRKIYLVAEGIYLWNYDGVIVSASVKFIIKKRMSLHVGVVPVYRKTRVSPTRTENEVGILPMISYRWLLGR